VIDLHNFFTAAKSTKFPIKPILGYHHTLIMLLHYLGKLKNQKFALLNHTHKTISNVQQMKIPNVMKISGKINTMQSINILPFVRSLSLTSLKLCS